MDLKKAKIECAATTPTIWYQVTLMLIRYISTYMHITFKFLYHQQFVYNFFVCFNNIKEPIFYKNSTMTWVANELILEAKSFHGHVTTLAFSPTKRSKKKHSIFYDKNDQNTQYVSHLNRSISPSTIMEQKSDKIVKSNIELVGEVER